MLPADRPPPSPLSLPTAKGTYRLLAVLVAIAVTLCTAGSASAEVGVSHAVAALVAALVTVGIVSFGLRAPERVMRRCLAVGTIGGGGLGGTVLLVFIVMALLGPVVEGTVIAMIGVTFFFAATAIVGMAIGLVLGAMGNSLVGLDGSDACDASDELLLRASKWLAAAGAVCAGLAVMSAATVSMVVGLSLPIVAAVGAIVVFARDLRRARWLGRVVDGTHTRWMIVSARDGDLADVPRFVTVDGDACDAALVARGASGSTPFRAPALASAGARIDAGAGHARAVLARRARTALGTVLIACFSCIAAWALPRPVPAPLTKAPPPAPARVATHPYRVPLDGPAVDITLYAGGACAVLAEGEARCWGRNRGRFRDLPGVLEGPMAIRPSVYPLRAIALGQEHACALDRLGTVDCWGKGDVGQLGSGHDTGDSPWPVRVAVVDQVTRLTLFRSTSCALRRDSTVWCWGQRPGYECGDGGCRYTAMPEPVRGLGDIEEIGGGDANLYARDARGRLSHVGRDIALRRGNDPSDQPVPIALPAPARRIATGTFGGCALLQGGEAKCWGDHDATARRSDQEPHDVPQLSGAVEVAVGLGFTCLVGADRNVACFGGNSDGELGDRTTEPRSAPAPVRDVDDVERVVADRHAACALRRDGAVWCWGDLLF